MTKYLASFLLMLLSLFYIDVIKETFCHSFEKFTSQRGNHEQRSNQKFDYEKSVVHFDSKFLRDFEPVTVFRHENSSVRRKTRSLDSTEPINLTLKTSSMSVTI